MWFIRTGKTLVRIGIVGVTIVAFAVCALLSLPVLIGVKSFKYFTGREKLGEKRTWDEAELRHKYQLRQLEVGEAFLMFGLTAFSALTWVFVLQVTVGVCIGFENSLFSMLVLPCMFALVVAGGVWFVLTYNESWRIAAMESEYAEIAALREKAAAFQARQVAQDTYRRLLDTSDDI